MKVHLRVITFFSMAILTWSFYRPAPDDFLEKCVVSEVYKKVSVDYGVKVLTTFGILEDAELILIPTTLDEGSYKVNITRKAADLYHLEGTEYCIKTEYCLELALYNEAILEIDQGYGYTKGTLFFK